MRFVEEMLHNKMIIAPLIALLTAQILKTLIYVAVHREFNMERLLGDGGMPSSHSATVMALVTAAAFAEGPSSPTFAICCIFAMIVMHDAVGVRRETGKQAVVINDMIEFFETMGKEIPAEEKLKEFVGHTPLQVTMGGILGVIMGMTVCVWGGG